MHHDPTRAELVGIVEELRRLDPNEDRSKELFGALEARVPCPSDLLHALIYGQDFEWIAPDDPAEEVIERALAYQPLITPPPQRS